MSFWIYGIYFGLTFGIVWFAYRTWQYMVVFYPIKARNVERLTPQYNFVSLYTKDGTFLEGCVYEPEGAAQKTVLYFGGRGQDVVGVLPKLVLHKPTYRWISYNYRGYGNSQGTPSETALLLDALLIVEEVFRRYGKVVIFGYSLGSCVATYAASKRVHACERLFLVGAFCSLESLAKTRLGFVPILMRYRFTTCSYLSKVQSPVSIFAAAEDRTVPLIETKRLDAIAPNQERFVVVAEKGHVDLLWSPLIYTYL